MFEHLGFEQYGKNTDLHHFSMDMDTFLKKVA